MNVRMFGRPVSRTDTSSNFGFAHIQSLQQAAVFDMADTPATRAQSDYTRYRDFCAMLCKF